MKAPRQYRDSVAVSVLLVLAACSQDSAPAADNSAALSTNGPAIGGATKTAKRFHYDGLCEASAAAVIDESHFAVASDDSETLIIYRRGQRIPIDTVQHSGVTDIEGAARIGGRIFWLTSHALNKDGVEKPKRKVLFSTNIVARSLPRQAASRPSLADVGTNFVDLRARSASQLGINEANLASWLNIEGLAATPEGDLLAGSRGAPQGQAHAYVVRIDKPSALVGLPESTTGGAAPGRKSVFRLNLGGRGIRSMERVGEGAQAYLILAGPRTDKGKLSFALFWWDGANEAVTKGPLVDFGGMAPEALIAWPDGEIQILGDNEANCKDDDGEDERPRRFPSISLRL